MVEPRVSRISPGLRSPNPSFNHGIAYLDEVEMAGLIRSLIPQPIGAQAAEFIQRLKVSGRIFMGLSEEDLNVLSNNDHDITRAYMELQHNRHRERHPSLHSIYPGLDLASRQVPNGASDLMQDVPMHTTPLTSSSSSEVGSNQLDKSNFQTHSRDIPFDSDLESTQCIESISEPADTQAGAVRPSLTHKNMHTPSRHGTVGLSVLDPATEISRVMPHLDGDSTGNQSPASDVVESHSAVPLREIFLDFTDLGNTSVCPPDSSATSDNDHLSRGVKALATSAVPLSQEGVETTTDLDCPPTSQAFDSEYISLLLAPCGALGTDGAVIHTAFNIPQHETAFSGGRPISPATAGNQILCNTAGYVYNGGGFFASINQTPHSSPSYDSHDPSTSLRPLYSRRLTETSHTPPSITPSYLSVALLDTERMLESSDVDSDDNFGLAALLRLSPTKLTYFDMPPEFRDIQTPEENGSIDGEIPHGILHIGVGSVNSTLTEHCLGVPEGLSDSLSTLAPDFDRVDNEAVCAETPASQENTVVQGLGQSRIKCSSVANDDSGIGGLVGFGDKKHTYRLPTFSINPIPVLPTLLSSLEGCAIFPPTATFEPQLLPEHVSGHARTARLDQVKSSPEINHRHMATTELRYDLSVSRQDQLNPDVNSLPSLDISQCADAGSDVPAYLPLDLDIPDSSLLEELSMTSPLFSSRSSERDGIKNYADLYWSHHGPGAGDAACTVLRSKTHRTLWPISSGYHERTNSLGPRRNTSSRLHRLSTPNRPGGLFTRDPLDIEDKNINMKPNVKEPHAQRELAGHDTIVGASSQIGVSQSWWGRVKEMFFTHASMAPEPFLQPPKRIRIQITERYLMPTWDGPITGLTQA